MQCFVFNLQAQIQAAHQFQCFLFICMYLCFFGNVRIIVHIVKKHQQKSSEHVDVVTVYQAKKSPKDFKRIPTICSCNNPNYDPK